MRNLHEGMDNDPTSSRNYDRDPTDDLIESVSEMEEYAASFLADENFDENSEFQNQEFSALNNQLDQLQSALDMLESRNADIHSELLALLHSNREVRRVIVEEMESTAQSSSSQVESTTTTSLETETVDNNNINNSSSSSSGANIPTEPLSSTTSTTNIVLPSSSEAEIFMETTTQIEQKNNLPEPPSLAQVIEATSTLIQSIDAIKLEKVTN